MHTQKVQPIDLHLQRRACCSEEGGQPRGGLQTHRGEKPQLFGRQNLRPRQARHFLRAPRDGRCGTGAIALLINSALSGRRVQRPPGKNYKWASNWAIDAYNLDAIYILAHAIYIYKSAFRPQVVMWTSTICTFNLDKRWETTHSPRCPTYRTTSFKFNKLCDRDLCLQVLI